ncbi:type II toxin-antitoxin system RelE/ParE family toxin [Dokdonella sp.]|uniref:type II toxin-antitoxin system RelE/ParE family toxin n=1 Tax=Dokdonella sp. TaxID=2291710 RepID=UPI003783119E
MNRFVRTEAFDTWLRRLGDAKARARIAQRIESAQAGNVGDCEPVGEGISEMRVHVGAGYRVYFTRIGDAVYLLLVGGNKSTQRRDIKRAIEMARYLKESK